MAYSQRLVAWKVTDHMGMIVQNKKKGHPKVQVAFSDQHN
jgi:hypothetical protein